MGHYATMAARIRRPHLKRPSLRAVAVALIPFCAMCFSVSAWDRVYPMVLGLPFNFFWLLSWIVLTSVCLWIVYRIESGRNS
jgi:hypothetical protein